MKIRYIFTACLLLAAASTVNAASRTIEIAELIESESHRALLAEKFLDLNSMADRLRISKERLPDGRWKLTFVTSGINRDLDAKDNGGWKGRLTLIDRWITITPQNSTPYLAKAQTLIDYAWATRGVGYANSVRSEDWNLFKQRISEAKKILEDSAIVSKISPVWYEQMQTIAKAEAWSDEDYLKLFQEGSNREPTYYFLYFEAASFFLPRWHGNSNKVAKFVDYAVDKTKTQEGQTLYARIYWSLKWALNEETFAPGNAKWPRMKAGFSDIVKSYPDDWNMNAFAFYACLAQDWKTFNKISLRMTTIDNTMWKSQNEFQLCSKQSFNHSQHQ